MEGAGRLGGTAGRAGGSDAADGVGVEAVEPVNACPRHETAGIHRRPTISIRRLGQTPT